MLAIMAARTAQKQLRLYGGGRQDSDRYGDCTDEERMPNNAGGQKRVAADGERKAQGPHQTQGLQDIVPNGDVRNVAEGAYFMIEDEVP